ncbi:MAG: PAQR family membrane homeostasis protein TrhA [Pararhizobium sp.]
MAPVRWHYDRAELLADGVVHVISVAFAVLGAAALLAMAAAELSPAERSGFGVYSVCLIATLGVSAAYNMWPVSQIKWMLRRFDHACIFLLVAGTYTPFALRLGATGDWLLTCVWIVAGLGMVLKIVFTGHFDRIAVFFYLALGWSGLAFFHVMAANLAPTTIILILIGGLAYTLGVVFHLWGSLRFQNAIWHTLVLVGAAFHYGAVMVTLSSLAGAAS